MILYCILVITLAALVALNHGFIPNFNRALHRSYEAQVHKQFIKHHYSYIHHFTRIYQMAVKPPNALSDFAVGDPVVAQVSDFKGSLSNPLVEFTVKSCIQLTYD